MHNQNEIFEAGATLQHAQSQVTKAARALSESLTGVTDPVVFELLRELRATLTAECEARRVLKTTLMSEE